MRLQPEYSDHVGAQFGGFCLDLSGYLDRIADFNALRINRPLPIGGQLNPAAAVPLNSRLDGSVMGSLFQIHLVHHLGQDRIGHTLFSSRSYSATSSTIQSGVSFAPITPTVATPWTHSG